VKFCTEFSAFFELKQFDKLYKIDNKIAPIGARYAFSPALERNFQNLYKIDPWRESLTNIIKVKISPK